jgi:hypothetical protein
MFKARALAFLISSFVVSVFACTAVAQDKGPLTEAKVKDLIEHGMQVEGCGDQTYAFTAIEIASPVKQKDGGRQYQLYPVHARFAVTCQMMNEQMRAEIDLRNDYYIDELGKWQSTDPGFDGNQNWDNTQNDVRCRAQNLAHLTVDSNGKVTGSTPAKDQSFGFPPCRLVPKAAE